MLITPAIKGQLTKAINAARAAYTGDSKYLAEVDHLAVKAVFLRHMPREQAKHATCKYLATVIY